MNSWKAHSGVGWWRTSSAWCASAGEHDQVLYPALPQGAQDCVPLDREAGAVLLRHAAGVGIAPRVVGRTGGGYRERDARHHDLPHRGRPGHRVDQPAALGEAEHGLAGSVRRGVGAPVLSRVEDEDLEQRAPAELAVEAPGLLAGRPDRKVVDEGAAPRLHEGLGGPGEVVTDLVVVPDRVHRRATEVGLQRRILAIVSMLGPEVGQASRHEIVAGDVRGLAAHVIGVDGVAHEEEEIGGHLGERVEDRVPVAGLAAVPAAAEIAAPGEAHRSRVGRRGRGHELAGGFGRVLGRGVAVAGGRFERLEQELAGQVAARLHPDVAPGAGGAPALGGRAAPDRLVAHRDLAPGDAAHPYHRGSVGHLAHRDQQTRLRRRGGRDDRRGQAQGETERNRRAAHAPRSRSAQTIGS